MTDRPGGGAGDFFINVVIVVVVVVVVVVVAGAGPDEGLQDPDQDAGDVPDDAGGSLRQGRALSQPPPRGRRRPVDARPPQLARLGGDASLARSAAVAHRNPSSGNPLVHTHTHTHTHTIVLFAFDLIPSRFSCCFMLRFGVKSGADLVLFFRSFNLVPDLD